MPGVISGQTRANEEALRQKQRMTYVTYLWQGDVTVGWERSIGCDHLSDAQSVRTVHQRGAEEDYVCHTGSARRGAHPRVVQQRSCPIGLGGTVDEVDR